MSLELLAQLFVVAISPLIAQYFKRYPGLDRLPVLVNGVAAAVLFGIGCRLFGAGGDLSLFECIERGLALAWTGSAAIGVGKLVAHGPKN